MAKAITLLESTLPDHRVQADALLTQLLPHTGKSLRIGLSGVPGVGKSTLIETLGLWLIDKGHKVAVLAIDPSFHVFHFEIPIPQFDVEQDDEQEDWDHAKNIREQMLANRKK